MSELNVVEICAGAGGQSLGLELAGFKHALAVELDANACNTLRLNRPEWKIAEGDAASLDVWNPADYQEIDLLAGGVPCPPFTIAGKQLGATDERDLFAWAVELCGIVRPRALLLENVRGLSMNRFAAYRQHVLDRLNSLGYVADWKLLQASDYGVSQLRPRFVLVAMRPEDFSYFHWPEPGKKQPKTVGDLLHDQMASRGWRGADTWRLKANDIAPTIVGGSKKHGGADLGPTRAKTKWKAMGVDGWGIADEPPSAEDPKDHLPRLTCDMVARIQGWDSERYKWEFSGRKTSRYRQIGNAFPPPVAEAIGIAIRDALLRKTTPQKILENVKPVHDPIYAVLRSSGKFMTLEQISKALGEPLDPATLDRHINHLKHDFEIEEKERRGERAYRLGEFKAFLGQENHRRHELFQLQLSKIS
ncbi:DNA cytosine methyltransferase [Thermomonospora curvata]|uniref:DNA (cytosine-5-)-methyltransferase n=1 Tax=Thermomonospora curvata (strain ATCC 19995 / DSM 43183 / JCM 3096 / KCTC 9072 / NBRC 15933 / NCIMB 10081 / Henssen B9) TaxID=471852 RepID=D1A866_THECD|nr:DNA (cytosine-5-)-methyltransferase [Thermomonospora curvata]ACZ00381.1 DNA-cytosine methyltransferase [Thermomonospora curvata DSM 43183]